MDVVISLIYIAIMLLTVVPFWKIFAKAGRPGWAYLVPIYNMYVWLKIIGKPVWWLVLFFLPIVNIVIIFLVSIELAKVFGRSAGFGVGLVFLPFVFAPILAFGDSEYAPPAVSAG